MSTMKQSEQLHCGLNGQTINQSSVKLSKAVDLGIITRKVSQFHMFCLNSLTVSVAFLLLVVCSTKVIRPLFLTALHTWFGALWPKCLPPHRLYEANQSTVIFTGISDLSPRFGRSTQGRLGIFLGLHSSIVWAHVPWNKFSNVFVNLGLFVFPPSLPVVSSLLLRIAAQTVPLCSEGAVYAFVWMKSSSRLHLNTFLWVLFGKLLVVSHTFILCDFS